MFISLTLPCALILGASEGITDCDDMGDLRLQDTFYLHFVFSIFSKLFSDLTIEVSKLQKVNCVHCMMCDDVYQNSRKSAEEVR